MASKKKDGIERVVQSTIPVSIKSSSPNSFPMAYSDNIWDVATSGSSLATLMGGVGQYDQNTINEALAANGGTYIDGDGITIGNDNSINHSNSVTQETTQGLYPITFDAQGHITGSGTAIGTATSSTNGLMSYTDKSKLEGWKVGGRNLIPTSSATTRIPATGTADNNYAFTKFDINGQPFTEGEYFTITADIEEISLSEQFITLCICNSTISTYRYGITTVINNGKIRITEKINSSVAGEIDNVLLIYAGRVGYTIGNAISVSNLKFERGAFATDWTPASISFTIGNSTQTFTGLSNIGWSVNAVNRQLLGAVNDYERVVIGLCELSAANTQSPYNWHGKIYYDRWNGNGKALFADIDIGAEYVGSYTFNYSIMTNSLNSNTSIDTGYGFRPCWFKYNNKYYGGLEFYQIQGAYYYCDGVGTFTPFLVRFYNHNTSTVLNSEIHSSIAFDSSHCIPNNMTYTGVSSGGGGTISSLDDVPDGNSRKLANYLPLSGGTMTGLLKINTGSGIEDATGNGMLSYHPTSWTGVSSSQWGAGAVDSQGVVRSSNTDLIHYRSGSTSGSYSVLDTYNYTTYCATSGHTHNYAGSSSAGGAANNVAGEAGSANSSRHIWFSDGTTETKRNYDDNFTYNPNLDTLSLAGAAVTAVSSSSTPTAYRNLIVTRTINPSAAGNPSYNERADFRGIDVTVTNKVYGSGTAESVFAVYGAVVDANGNESSQGYAGYFKGRVKTGSLHPTSITASGAISSSGSITAPAVYQTSDDRLKDYKGDFTYDINKIDKIPTRYFEFKNDETKKIHIGTSAQAVQEVLPQIVNEGEDGYLSVDYSKLSLVALDCIKQLKAEISALKQEISELKK